MARSNPFWRMSATLVELRGKQKSLEIVLEKAGSKEMQSGHRYKLLKERPIVEQISKGFL